MRRENELIKSFFHQLESFAASSLVLLLVVMMMIITHVTHFLHEVTLRGLIWRASRSDVVMNPFTFLLTHYRPKHSFSNNLESD